ncbi:MAG: hypothetical protein AAGK67_13270 [Pseudomonadota bacterium]
MTASSFTIPPFVAITDVSFEDAEDAEYVISNEATGRYFSANRETVTFLQVLKDNGSVPVALHYAGIPEEQGKRLLQQLVDSGVLVQAGATQAKAPSNKAPLESKLVMTRWDILDVRNLTSRFAGLGRLLYSPVGYFLWGLAMAAMAFALLTNREKLILTLTQIYDASLTQWLVFTSLFIALKFWHELGHATAYQEMCRQENLDPGPIRTGICIFAFTPFPFTDVTGAWRLKSRFRRVMIGAGGIYFETWVMAVLTLFWAQTQTGLLQTIILQLAIIAGALALLFNLNPAVKLDGYFILTDYLRKPNLAGRASVAARTTFARAFGADMETANRGELSYWLISYIYRWSIFAGIFWLIYQFDRRLAPIALVILLSTLLIRPLYASAKFALGKGVRPLKTAFVTGSVALLIALSFVPLPFWQNVPGQYIVYETRFLEPTEPGRVEKIKDGAYRLESPELQQKIADLSFRLQTLENLRRANFSSAEEQARVGAEIAGYSNTRAELINRQEALSVSPPENAVWTALDSRWLDGLWVARGPGTTLAAVSTRTDAHLSLRLQQRLLQQSLNLELGTDVIARLHHEPTCEIRAQLKRSPDVAIAVDGIVQLKAEISPEVPECFADITHGSAVVARLEGSPKSLVQRIKLFGARLLQDRLSIDQNSNNQETRR